MVVVVVGPSSELSRAPREGHQLKAESHGNEPRPRCHTAGSPAQLPPRSESRFLVSLERRHGGEVGPPSPFLREARPAERALNDRPHLKPVSASSRWIFFFLFLFSSLPLLSLHQPSADEFIESQQRLRVDS